MNHHTVLYLICHLMPVPLLWLIFFSIIIIYNIMGKYDGVISDNDDKNQVKFSLTDIHFVDNVLHINKNLTFILHKSQYSDKFTISNDVLDINKDKLTINPKSIIPVNSLGTPNGTIIVDQNDKLILNTSSDFFTNYNSTLYCNLGAGLTRDDQNRITIAIAKCNLKFVNNELCLDMNAMINEFNCIKLDDKQRLRLAYNADDFIKDSTGKIWLKLDDKHLVRTQNGIEINIDNDTIRYDTNESKSKSSIDKYVVPKYSQNGDIYLDANKKMKLNINNYVDDNIGSKVIMNTNNKIDLDIVDQTAGEIYFDSNNKLTIRLGHYFTRDTSGHIIPIVNNDHGVNLNNYKLNLDVSAPLEFVNKKLTLGYTPYFKLSSDKLDIDITKLQTDIVIPKQNEGIKLNSDGTLSIDSNVLTSMLNVGSLSGLKIVGNQLIVDEALMSSNLIRLDSNSTLKRRDNNFYEIVYDRVSIDADFTTGELLVKPTYVPSIVTSDYIKNKVINESYFKDILKFQGPCILKRCALCYWNLDDESSVDETISTNVIINKFQNQKYKFNDFYYFTCENNPSYHYKHYSFAIFPEVMTDNYIHFNNTNQKIKYTDIFNRYQNLNSIASNFVIEPEKKTVDINSTLLQAGNDNYIKILYNNQGIVFKFGKMIENYLTSSSTFPNEIIVSITTILNKKHVITFFYNTTGNVIIILNSQVVYNQNNIVLFIEEPGKDNLTTYKYHDFYLANNNSNSQSFNGKLYDYSMLQNISESETFNLHEYYKYIHNI